MADAKPLAPFTPGPLHVTREVDSEGYAQHTVRAATGSPVAVLSNYSPIEQKANAALYSAAPDHHKVALELDRLCLVLESAVRHSDPANYDAMVALVRANRAAIAKATGSAQ